MNRDDLQRLSKEELIDLVLKFQRPDKTSRTSSKPPSKDRKERRDHVSHERLLNHNTGRAENRAALCPSRESPFFTPVFCEGVDKLCTSQSSKDVRQAEKPFARRLLRPS